MIDLLMLNLVHVADAVEDINTAGMNIIAMGQRLSLVAAGIAFLIGGFYYMLGGDRGRPKAVGWFIGGSVGLLIVLGALELARSIRDNISF